MQVPPDVCIYIYRCCVVCLLLQVLIEEEIEWMAPSDSGIPTLEEMLTWKVIGPVSSCTLNMCLRANILSMIIYLSIPLHPLHHRSEIQENVALKEGWFLIRGVIYMAIQIYLKETFQTPPPPPPQLVLKEGCSLISFVVVFVWTVSIFPGFLIWAVSTPLWWMFRNVLYM